MGTHTRTDWGNKKNSEIREGQASENMKEDIKVENKYPNKTGWTNTRILIAQWRYFINLIMPVSSFSSQFLSLPTRPGVRSGRSRAMITRF